MSSKLIFTLTVIACLAQVAVAIKCYQGTSITNGTLPTSIDCPTGAVSCQKSVSGGTVTRQCYYQQCAVLTPGNTTCSADSNGGLYCCCASDNCNPATTPSYQIAPLISLLFLFY